MDCFLGRREEALIEKGAKSEVEKNPNRDYFPTSNLLQRSCFSASFSLFTHIVVNIHHRFHMTS